MATKLQPSSCLPTMHTVMRLQVSFGLHLSSSTSVRHAHLLNLQPLVTRIKKPARGLKDPEVSATS